MEIILLRQLRNYLVLLVSYSHALKGEQCFPFNFTFNFLGRKYFCIGISDSWTSINRSVLSERSSQGLSFIKLKKDTFSYLNITSIGIDLVEDSIDCAFACLEFPSCFSCNLQEVPDFNKKLCELLPSDLYNNTDKFITHSKFHHLSIAVGVKLTSFLIAVSINNLNWPKLSKTIIAYAEPFLK